MKYLQKVFSVPQFLREEGKCHDCKKEVKTGYQKGKELLCWECYKKRKDNPVI